MQWLESLGAMTFNWNALSMRFKIGETAVVLQGDLSLCKSPVSSKAMMWALKREGQVMILELGMISVEEPGRKGDNTVPEAIKMVLLQYSTIFQIPTGLPPPRSLINVRPYRYPQA